MFCAFIPALILQCGTTAAAAIIIAFTPVVGLGYRSLGYITYGGTAVVVMILAISSTIFARISETRDNKRSPVVKSFTAFIAIALRRVALFLALINAMGLIVISCFPFSDFLNSCYCYCDTSGYIVMTFGGWVSTMGGSRIVGTAISTASVAIYMTFLALTSTPPGY